MCKGQKNTNTFPTARHSSFGLLCVEIHGGVVPSSCKSLQGPPNSRHESPATRVLCLTFPNFRHSTGCPPVEDWMAIPAGHNWRLIHSFSCGPSPIAAALGGLNPGMLSISGIFDKHLAAESRLFQSSQSSQTTGVLLDGQVIFPLSLRRKFVQGKVVYSTELMDRETWA